MESLLQSKDDSLTRRISGLADRVIAIATAGGMTLFLASIGVRVMRPLPNRDTPLKVHPTLPFLIHVESVIHHISDTQE